MPGDPKWCELFLLLYRTHYSTQLKVNKQMCNSFISKHRRCCKTIVFLTDQE